MKMVTPSCGSDLRRIKLDQLLIILVGNLNANVNPCCPRERFPHISSHHTLWPVLLIEKGIGLSLKRAFYYYCILISVFYFSCNITPKIPKPLQLSLYFLLDLLTNTFSSSWVRQPFLYWKVLQLISYTWEPSRYFSGAVAGERSAIGKLVW